MEIVRNTPPIVFMLVFYFFISAQITPHLGVDALAKWMGDSDSRLLSALFGERAGFGEFFQRAFVLGDV